ncbi:phage holin family protein [Rhodoluna sp. KAS3]|jgi:putative membrane protein|uniref:phage holin family protein n=1 Tax=Rhodoluna sp. KAS3 TaxID=942880 RepID=UPI00223223C9|nr:phage holin family protein [Rhodoluna sp. KAS3]BDS49713.1 membrane protein [Rhodoluna sp. KAS3]
MIRFLVGTVINAIALWVVTLCIPAIKLNPYGGTDFWAIAGSFLLVGAVFGLVSAIVAPVIKVLALPLYILTFGLISFLINGALLLFVAWLSQLFGDDVLTIYGFSSDGLTIDSLGWAILGSIVMSIASFFGRAVFKALKLL